MPLPFVVFVLFLIDYILPKCYNFYIIRQEEY